MDAAKIRRIVKESVRETLTAMGVDVSSPDALIALQRDMSWVRRTRQGSEDMGRRARLAAVGAALSGLTFLLWEGIKAALRIKGG